VKLFGAKQAWPRFLILFAEDKVQKLSYFRTAAILILLSK